MTLTTVLLVLGLGQDSADRYYKFKRGTTWTFDHAIDGKKWKETFRVVELKDDSVIVETTDEWEGEGKPRVEKTAWFVRNGYLTWSQIKGEERRDVFRLLKVGSKKGDSWKALEGEEATVTHQGATEVKVPAGSYKDVVQVRFQGEVTIRNKQVSSAMDYFFAPGVGLVKVEIFRDGKFAELVELTQFKEGE